jgi:hypothetical protein
MDVAGKGRGLNGGSIVKGPSTNYAMRQQHDNWEQHEIFVFIKCKYDCCNPSLGFATKAKRAYKVVGQEEAQESHCTLPGVWKV